MTIYVIMVTIYVMTPPPPPSIPPLLFSPHTALDFSQLLELMVTIYVMMAPLGLVPRLLWMAVPGCFVVTLIFYGEAFLKKKTLLLLGITVHLLCQAALPPQARSPSPPSLRHLPPFMARAHPPPRPPYS